MPPFLKDILLLGGELALYALVLGGLFRLRATLGLGLFVSTLSTLHLLETYLATQLYLAMPGGFTISPGSSILFTGKLVMLLLVYIQEDAATARQPIYGLLAGNFLIVGLVLMMQHHDVLPLATGGAPDLRFLDGIGWLMVWGTTLLYVDSILIVLLYEKLGRRLAAWPTLRIWVAAAIVLTFDQAGFFIALRLVLDLPLSTLVGGWIAKLIASLAYAGLASLYLRRVEPDRRKRAIEHTLRELFEILTYRERYYALREDAGRDALTGVLTRARLETHGRQSVDLAVAAGQSVSVFVLDLDRFKGINDRHGHAAGDSALRTLAAVLLREAKTTDYVFRYGGDEFVICAGGLSPEGALRAAERLADSVRAAIVPGLPDPLSVSIGVATGPAEGRHFAELFDLADSRLYAAKHLSRMRETSREEAVLAQLSRRPGRRVA